MAVTLLNLPKIISIEHTIEPVWAKNSGRNSNSGKFSGTFVGWFDTLKVSVGQCNQTQMTSIRNAIETPIIQAVTFKDSKTGNNKTEDFYGTAITALTHNTKGIYKPFSFSIKAVARRGDM